MSKKRLDGTNETELNNICNVPETSTLSDYNQLFGYRKTDAKKVTGKEKEKFNWSFWVSLVSIAIVIAGFLCDSPLTIIGIIMLIILGNKPDTSEERNEKRAELEAELEKLSTEWDCAPDWDNTAYYKISQKMAEIHKEIRQLN